MNQTVVITGTTQGIGRVTVQALAAAGCHVIMLVRNRSAGEQVRAQLRALHPNSAIEVIQCDLASLASVRAAAEGEYPTIRSVEQKSPGIWICVCITVRRR